ncbi:DUF1508 domain-containing protein [Natronorubrum sp. JWXQ-INN-674]|uniref:DUF1508 domain-containing protein n=1 Tax=Natronorubrum halalkaliphilum TaxID=2691917 RepID=A0A6B0VT02_9EURY|nr:amphi-Trp domain-containing protein [Natronorubrum halalkaliphilum]MXV63649.1 DUF1508 domain-containing protein [Natronorubrum halalkaliphilum]
MVDSPTDSDSEAGTESDSVSEFELERAYDRDELAAVFDTLATALADDRPLRIADGERTATISIPSRIVAAIEAERETDADPPVTELELELEWDDPDGSSLAFEAERDDPPGVVTDGRRGTQTDVSEPETDPATATATIPPDAVTGRDQGDDDEPRVEPEVRRADALEDGPDTGDDSEDPTEPDAESEAAHAPDEKRGERTSRFEVYEDRAGQWRWRLVHWNGNIVADGGEGYASRSNARRAVRGVMRSAPTARLVDRNE